MKLIWNFKFWFGKFSVAALWRAEHFCLSGCVKSQGLGVEARGRQTSVLSKHLDMHACKLGLTKVSLSHFSFQLTQFSTFLGKMEQLFKINIIIIGEIIQSTLAVTLLPILLVYLQLFYNPMRCLKLWITMCIIHIIILRTWSAVDEICHIMFSSQFTQLTE